MNPCFIGTDRSSLRVPREIAALIKSLHMRKTDVVSLNNLSHQEWTSLLTFCDLAHLTLVLAQLPMQDFPSWVAERLKVNVADNAQRFERVKVTYAEAAETLERAGIDHILIKGFTQAPDYVNNPRLRMQSDLDLYCQAKTIKSAQIALQTIGYIPEKEQDYSRADHIPSMIRLGNWKWRENPFDPEMPLSIELHFCLWNETISRFSIPEVERFWERRIARDVDGLSFPCLNPADHLGYFTLHILRGILSGDWIIHHVYELAIFLHTHATDDTFWKTWRETHTSTLRSFETISFYYARAWFGCDLHQQALDDIAALPSSRQRWLRRFAGSALEGMFQQNKDYVWLHLSFLDSPKAKLALLRRVFIPNKIPTTNSPTVRFKNRQLRKSREAHPYIQYLTYIFARCASYGYLNMTTILRGLRWRLS